MLDILGSTSKENDEPSIQAPLDDLKDHHTLGAGHVALGSQLAPGTKGKMTNVDGGV